MAGESVSERAPVTGGSRYDVLVIGVYGHIGLPFGIALAESGLQVALYDIDHEKGRLIAEGRMPFLEYDAEPMLRRVLGKTLHLAREISAVRESRTLVITIGTPVDEYMNPKVMPILSLAEQLLHQLVPG